MPVLDWGLPAGGGSGPTHCILQNAAHMGVQIGGVGLVAGLEEEHFAVAALPGTTAADNLAGVEPAEIKELIGGGNIEEFAVGLFHFQLKVFRHALGDGVGGHAADHPLEIVVFIADGTGGAHERHKGLGGHGGV